MVRAWEWVMLGITSNGELIKISESGMTGQQFLGFIVFDTNDLSEKHQLMACRLVSKDCQQLQKSALQALHINQSHDPLMSEQLLPPQT